MSQNNAEACFKLTREKNSMKIFISNLRSFKAQRKSQATLCGGVEWIFVFARQDNDKVLKFMFLTNDLYKSCSWKLLAEYSIRLYKSQEDGSILAQWNGTYTTDPNSKYVRVAFKEDEGDVKYANSQTGLISPINLDVLQQCNYCECEIRVLKLDGLKLMNDKDLPVLNPRSSASPHDRVLDVGGVKFYVQSQVLSMWSGYFQTFFHSPFEECEKVENTIEDVNADDFEKLLRAMYPQALQPNKDNVESLLLLADRFEVMHIFDRCRRFLLEDNLETMNVFTLMLLADKYKFLDVQEIAVRSLLNEEKLSAAIDADKAGFNRLSSSSRDELLNIFRTRNKD